MTDEFNLVPTNNLEKHLDNILRAASGDEPQYDLAPNWRVEQYLAAIAAKLPGGGGLPPVTASDAGKVATVNNSGVWGAQEPIGKKFIVTLTPTSPNYSGTMDKTVAEIDVAYKAGRKVIFRLDGRGASLPVFDCAVNVVEDGGDTYPSYQAFVLIGMADSLLDIYTYSTVDGTDDTYHTRIYTLTPAT